MKILKRSLLLLLTVCLLLAAASCGQMNLPGRSDVAPGDSSYDSKVDSPSGLPGRAGDDSVYESSRPDSGRLSSLQMPPGHNEGRWRPCG